MPPPATASARAAAASPAQALVEGEPALGEPVALTGRDRQAAVGISDGGSRQQRLSDVAVAARPRQPDVAGAERVPQVEQHRRLPETVIGLGAQQPAPPRIRPQEANWPRPAVTAQDADRFQQGLGRGRRLAPRRRPCSAARRNSVTSGSAWPLPSATAEGIGKSVSLGDRDVGSRQRPGNRMSRFSGQQQNGGRGSSRCLRRLL